MDEERNGTTEDEERKARLKKMVATTQVRLSLETDEERRVRLEHQSDNPIYIPILKGVIIISLTAMS